MIGASDRRLGWVQAAVLSVTLHGAAAAALVVDADWLPARTAPPAGLQVEITPLGPAATDPQETLTSILGPTDDQEEIVASLPAPEVAPDEVLPLAVATPQLLAPVAPTAAIAPQTTTGAPQTAAPAAPDSATQAQPSDPRLTELFQRIRDNLTQPCLLALPSLRGDDQIQLSVLTADDGLIAGLVDQLTEGIDAQITPSSALLDRRQCPGLTFARRDPLYPVFGLGLQLETQDIPSGQSLRGQILGGAGRYNTLLLVDDNGVIHDLRRFLIRSADRIRFDVPIARLGQARDTHFLIVAVATPARPETISARAGELAQDFFAQLDREIPRDALIAIGSVYVR